jgi:hypothetical protein
MKGLDPDVREATIVLRASVASYVRLSFAPLVEEGKASEVMLPSGSYAKCVLK